MLEEKKSTYRVLVTKNGSISSTDILNEENILIQERAFINIYTIPCKLAFLITFAFQGSYVPFLNLFLKSIGLSASQAGFITGLRAISSLIAGPF